MEAISLEKRLQSSGLSDVDFKSVSATLTGCRTHLVSLHTQAESLRTRMERCVGERRRRISEIKRYQSLLIELEQWLVEAQATITTEIRLTSARVVRDQIRASQVSILSGFGSSLDTRRTNSSASIHNIFLAEP